MGGPASVLIAFLLVGTMLFTVVHALGELAVLFPIQGSFAVYGTRFLDPAWGYATQHILLLYYLFYYIVRSK